MKNLFIVILILCGTIIVAAQTKKFRWTTELCEYEGTYDAAKYTENQIKATYELFYAGDFRLEYNATARNYAEIKSLSTGALDKEHTTKSNILRGLDIVKSAYWQTLREKKLKEMQQVYNLSRITIEAYENPAKIKEYTRADACVETYAAPLIEGGNALLITWRKVNEESRKKNGNPERLRQIFEARYNSPDKYQHAQIEVMTFGWWNCANQSIQYVKHDDEPEKNFKKLFKRVRTIACDEP